MHSFFTKPSKSSDLLQEQTVLNGIRIKSAVQAIQAIAEAIRDLKEVPSGTLYASVMKYLTLSQYERIIDMLIRSEVITKDNNNLLKWSAK